MLPLLQIRLSEPPTKTPCDELFILQDPPTITELFASLIQLLLPAPIRLQHPFIISLLAPAPIKLPEAPVKLTPIPVPVIVLFLPATIAATPPALVFSQPPPIKL